MENNYPTRTPGRTYCGAAGLPAGLRNAALKRISPMSHNRAPIGRNQDDCDVLDGHH
jgi:hypothetical protein